MHSTLRSLRFTTTSVIVSAAFALPALASPGTPYTGAIPSEVKTHLAKLDRYPADDYFKYTPASLVDLNGDGTPELVVDGGLDDGGTTAFGIYEKKGGRYNVIGEAMCEKGGFTVEKAPDAAPGAWVTFVCGDGTKLAFDEAKHRYGQLRAQAKAKKVAAKKRRR